MGRETTQSDVAREAGVSRGLVSLALSDSPVVAAATKQRIREVANRLGYMRHLGAASLASRRSLVVGMVLPDLRNPFFEDVVDAVQASADEAGLLSLIATASNDSSREALIVERFQELRASGIIVVSPVQPADRLAELGDTVPVVLIGTEPVGGCVDVIHVDEVAAAELVLDHLVERRWQRVLYVSAEAGAGEVWVEHRRVAFESSARRRGVPFAVARADDSVTDVLRSALDVGDRPRLAVVAHNDLVAAEVVFAVRAMGLAPGQDVAVVGFDDTYLARHAGFSMSSVRQDADELSAVAMKALRSRAEEPTQPGREWVMDPTLSVRASS